MIAILKAKKSGLLRKEHWSCNIVSGVIVGVVALPLAMAFAIASGAKPEQGMYTAIIAGLLGSLFGGSQLQISGPTGAFIVILAGVTAKYGIAGLQLASLMAGFILLAMGFARLGATIKYIPDPVIVGFTTGIGVIIFVGQWKDFFGLKPEAGGEHFHEKLWSLLQALPSAHLPSLALGAATLAVLLVSPKIFKRVPAPLVALIAATSAQSFFHFEAVATIGSTFGGIPQNLPRFEWLSFSASDLLHLIGPAFTIAMLGAIESLLSAVVADGMTGTRHDSDQELIGQGIANIVTPLFGGFAATGAIARTATNIRSGATSPLSGVVHSITLLLIILLLAPLASHMPLCALSAILFLVAYNMSELHLFFKIIKMGPKPDVAVLLITFLLTVFSDLVIAVNIGVILASLLFMKRMASAVRIEEQSIGMLEGLDKAPSLPARTVIYSIDGPFFFGAAERLENTLEAIQSHPELLVLRMGGVPFMDATGLLTLDEIVEDCHRHKTRLVLCGVLDNVRRKLEKAGISDKLGRGNIIGSIKELEHFDAEKTAAH